MHKKATVNQAWHPAWFAGI